MAQNRGDIFDSSRELSLRLLYTNICLFIVLLIIDVLIVSVNWRFSIITNPTETVKFTAFAVAMVESVFFLCCGAPKNPDTYPVKTRFADRLCNLLKAVLIFVTSCVVIHFVTVLYGAQVFEKYEETFHFSLLLSTLSIVPCLAVIGVKTEAWSRLYFERRPENDAELCLLYLVVCSYLGAWLGAFPIPLDWDRSWQEWPITVCVGALLGHTTGALLSIGHMWVQINAENIQPKSK